MNRIAIRGVLALVAVVAGAAGAAVAAAPPRASLEDFVCQKAMDPESRAVQVVAVMRPVAKTKHLALRFELLTATPAQGGASSPYTPVSGGDLGTWITPSNSTLGQRPGDRWIVNKQVVDLNAPALYRFRVSFRWTGARGRVLQARTLQSPRCYEPEMRPDLVVDSLTIQPARNPAKDHYVVALRNTGATASGAFELEVQNGTATPLTRTVASLKPHWERSVTLAGPACTAGTNVVATADPGDQVDVSSRAQASITVACPAGS